MSIRRFIIFVAGVGMLALPNFLQVGTTPSYAGMETQSRQAQKQTLGRMLFYDTNLSMPAGQSCGSCHDPRAGYEDPDKEYPTSEGAVPGVFGTRNCPTSAYQALAPDFHYDEEEGLYVGGQFWDGRGKDLVEQAMGPFLNPVEMNNASAADVVAKVARAHYAPLFRAVYGRDAFNDVDAAYRNIADAIAAYERSPELNRFNSRYDRYLAGQKTLTKQELRGLALFEGKGKCNLCHPSRPDGDNPPVFTDFSYDNLGVPRNLAIKEYADNPALQDLGLGAIVGDPLQNGKFKVPTLRNVAISGPYLHNGIFDTLTEVVRFYNARDTSSIWGPPEVPENVNTEELGQLQLTDDEIADIVAFMGALTDQSGGPHRLPGKNPAQSPKGPRR